MQAAIKPISGIKREMGGYVVGDKREKNHAVPIHAAMRGQST